MVVDGSYSKKSAEEDVTILIMHKVKNAILWSSNNKSVFGSHVMGMLATTMCLKYSEGCVEVGPLFNCHPLVRLHYRQTNYLEYQQAP
jgi:hypothetical protein